MVRTHPDPPKPREASGVRGEAKVPDPSLLTPYEWHRLIFNLIFNNWEEVKRSDSERIHGAIRGGAAKPITGFDCIVRPERESRAAQTRVACSDGSRVTREP